MDAVTVYPGYIIVPQQQVPLTITIIHSHFFANHYPYVLF